MRVIIVSLSLLTSLALPAATRADEGFRCSSGRLVDVGDGMAEVADRCGEPDAAVHRTEVRRIRHRISHRVGDLEESFIEEQEVEIPIDEWTYDLGPRSFVRTVVFENARVRDIATGSYGRKSR
jgi:hypothetical protein